MIILILWRQTNRIKQATKDKLDIILLGSAVFLNIEDIIDLWLNETA